MLIWASFFSKKPKSNIAWPSIGSWSNYDQYTVWSSWDEQWQVYGSVVATNWATITTSVWGVVQALNCQIGAEVKKGQIIAQFTPPADLQTENLGIQKDFLGQQVGVLQNALSAWLENVDLQIATLKDQRNTNQQQLALLEQNLENAKKQKQLTSWDTNLQLSSLQTQLSNLKQQQTADITKTDAALKNQIQSAKTSALGALSAVDNSFSITSPQLIHESDIYIGAKDTAGKEEVISEYPTVKYLIDNLDAVSGDVASTNLQTIASYFSLAARVVNNSVVDTRYLPQSKIDSLFTTFNTTANVVIGAKTNYDATYASTITVRTTYNTQITSLQNQILSLGGNKSELNDISSDTQINWLQSQVNALRLTINSFDNQLATLQNSKNIQTQSTNGQLLTVQQNYQLIANNLWGEALYSPIDGVVKSSSVVIWNRVWANVQVCSIGPKTVEGLKVQLFSAKDLTIWQEVFIYDGMMLLGTGTIDYETLSVDPQTQDKWYEITTLQWDYREGEKVTIRFDNTPASDEIWIPIHYVSPKLDWYYVTKKFADGNKDVVVEVGDINNSKIRILSGLVYGDIIVK